MRKNTVFMWMGLIILLQFLPGTLSAQIRPGAVGLSPSFGGYVFEGDQNIEDYYTYGVSLGYAITENWGAEAGVNIINTEYDSGSQDINVYSYHFDGLYHFMPSEKLVPFVAVGIGAINYSPEDDSSSSAFAPNYGAGIKYFLTENIAFRFDIRHVISLNAGDSDHNLACTIGFNFLAPRNKTKQVAVVAPEPVPVPAPKDTDGDGVYDNMDKCPGTPKGVRVDSKGCPLDTDGDGVPDYLDKCPNTPKGATVDEFGCWVCKNLMFEFNKWNLNPEYHACLDEGVDYMKNNPDMKVEIQGHTDNIGAQEYNQMLSEKRAVAVRDYLISKGIEKERLTIKGFGFSNPITSNATEEGRAKNRRVQFEQITK